jgi:peroxiredoxin family protein
MKEPTTDLIIVMTKGIYDEVSSVGLLIANGALTSGKTIGLFLTSSAIDLVRKNGLNHIQVPPVAGLSALQIFLHSEVVYRHTSDVQFASSNERVSLPGKEAPCGLAGFREQPAVPSAASNRLYLIVKS